MQIRIKTTVSQILISLNSEMADIRFKHCSLVPLMNVCGLYKFDWTLSLWAKCWTRAVFRAPVNVLSLLQWKMNNYKPSTQLFRHQGSDCLLNLSFNSTGPHVCRGEKRTACTVLHPIRSSKRHIISLKSMECKTERFIYLFWHKTPICLNMASFDI